jgi:hypothetical protein
VLKELPARNTDPEAQGQADVPRKQSINEHPEKQEPAKAPKERWRAGGLDGEEEEGYLKAEANADAGRATQAKPGPAKKRGGTARLREAKPFVRSPYLTRSRAARNEATKKDGE